MLQNHLMGYPDGMPGGPPHEQNYSLSLHWRVAYETMMFFVGHVSARRLPPQTTPQLPGASRSECLGGFRQCLFAATVSALSVCP